MSRVWTKFGRGLDATIGASTRRRTLDRRARRAPEPARDGILPPTSPLIRSLSVYETPRATRRAPADERTRPTTGGIFALAIWFLFSIVALLIVVSTVSAFAGLTRTCPRLTNSTSIAFQEESIVYDRTGEIELARFGEFKREVVTFEDIPPILVDATTAIEDRTFWENTGFDPIGDRRRRRRHPPRPPPRRLDDHPAARPPAAARRRARPGPGPQVTERKLKEIIQSIRVTAGLSRASEGKQRIITAYLNQNYYGNELRRSRPPRAATSARSSTDLTARRGGDPRRPPEVAVDLRPRPERGRGVRRPVAEDGDVPGQDDARRPGGHRDRPAPQPDSRPARRGRPDAADRGASSPPPTSTRPRTRRSSWRRSRQPSGSRRTSCGRSARSSPPSCAARTSQTCAALENGGLRITTTLDVDLQKIAEKWVKAATIVPNAKDPRRSRRAARPDYEPWMRNLRDKNVAQRRARSRWTTRPARSSPTSAAPSTTATNSAPAVPAAVRRPRRRLAPARARRSSRSTT